MIKATANVGPGWGYGGVVNGFTEMHKIPKIQGYFPISFVQTLSSGDMDSEHQRKLNEQEELMAKMRDNLQKKPNMGKSGKYSENEQTYQEPQSQWKDYATNAYANEEAVFFTLLKD